MYKISFILNEEKCEELKRMTHQVAEKNSDREIQIYIFWGIINSQGK